ncbi:undecaprenol kinase [Priestia taiwanensis]|uniref:Diacylglycerol kinase n=1 Tax=Priestia taiwanensis TaxID=1347902 RepID=A0A917AVX6_9BACI|nr:undecaprenol kinase [Priestia taiwanensis]GGE74459.1 diacylglycerol kinase [Priestia taiwanensis]
MKSFYYAYCGIKHVCTVERNMKIHLVAAGIVLGAGMYFRINQTEWLVLLLVIAGVLALEMVNSAIEATVDLVTAERHPLAKIAKDVAAGAVLLFTCFAVIIGFIVFWPYIDRAY